MALPLPSAVFLLLLVVASPVLCAAQSPISQPPSPGAPTASPLLRPDADSDDDNGSSVPPSLAPAPAGSPGEDKAAAASPPAPTDTSPLPSPAEAPSSAAHSPAPAPSTSLHSAASTPSPAPVPAADKEGDDDDDSKEKKVNAPAPAPTAMEVKANTGGADEQRAVDAERRHGEGEMNGGKKAGVVVGVFSATAVLCLAAVVYRKRQANIRRSRYADYSARLELV
ncbi:unnamed protein product [Triticum turgidum subsp. durum]|uniref:Uncharacterized protein n=1 Tax=Triticum turgidum subsp. durum TaxID=4567 RepID=A0A9R0XP68_TRITD|nr:unnamed protein product [Triticum turgidum subsp. durum]